MCHGTDVWYYMGYYDYTLYKNQKVNGDRKTENIREEEGFI